MSRSACELLATGGVWRRLDEWRLLEVTGHDAERFLQALLTANLREIPDGRSLPFALLDSSGLLQGFGQLARLAAGRFVLLVPGDAVSSVTEKLTAHIIADRVTVATMAAEAPCLALGPAAVELAVDRDPARCFATVFYGHHGFVAWDPDPIVLPGLAAADEEVLRVLSGWPRWGVDARPGQLVNETTLAETAVSHHKGCFLGQETVNKVRSHRGAAFAPMLLEPVAGALPEDLPPGSALTSFDGRRAATVLASIHWQERQLLQVALRRDLRVKDREISLVTAPGAPARFVVRSLPAVVPRSARESADLVFKRAVEAFQQGRDDEAIRLLWRCIAVDSTHADAYESLGVIHRQRGDWAAAEELMRRLLEVEPESILAHSNLSLIYMQTGRIEDAEAELALAAQSKLRHDQRLRQNETARARNEQARAAENARRENLFRELLQLDADDPLANFSLGQLCAESGRHTEAIVHLERTVVHDPSHSAAYLWLGRALENTGALAAARDAYARGLEVASRKGVLMVANQIQERMSALVGAEA